MFKVRQGQRIVLASSSPRRRELLAGCGITFEIQSPDIDERVGENEKPKDLVERLAGEKGRCISQRDPEAWIIAADTIVVQDGEILGKPADRRDAARMLGSLQGRWHVVWGGIAILHETHGISDIFSFESRVLMQPMSAADIESYIATGEPMDKAGSYAIQGIGAALVREVQGSYTNIVGLNLAAVVQKLQQRGVVGALV